MLENRLRNREQRDPGKRVTSSLEILNSNPGEKLPFLRLLSVFSCWLSKVGDNNLQKSSEDLARPEPMNIDQ